MKNKRGIYVSDTMEDKRSGNKSLGYEGEGDFWVWIVGLINFIERVGFSAKHPQSYLLDLYDEYFTKLKSAGELSDVDSERSLRLYAGIIVFVYEYMPNLTEENAKKYEKNIVGKVKKLLEGKASDLPEEYSQRLLDIVRSAVRRSFNEMLGVQTPTAEIIHFANDRKTDDGITRAIKNAPLHEPVRRSARVDPIDFLRMHYGKYLTFFGADENQLFQNDLREHDDTLLVRVRQRLSYLRRTAGVLVVQYENEDRTYRPVPKLEAVIPRMKAKSDQILERNPELKEVLEAVERLQAKKRELLGSEAFSAEEKQALGRVLSRVSGGGPRATGSKKK